VNGVEALTDEIDRPKRRLAAIVAADIVGYSRLMEIDEVGTHARLKALRREVLDPVTKRFGGRVFKHTGDGVFAEFLSAVDAVHCMIEVQMTLNRSNLELPEERKLELRVGISMGDVIVDGDDLYGNGVNVAARMETLADAGGICVTGNVHEQAASAIDIRFENMGDQQVKNIKRPIKAFRLKIDERTGVNNVLEDRIGNQQPSSSLVLPEKPSIAVLPFQNMSGDSEQEFFADGMTEDIITSLSRYRSLFVIARNSTFAYKGQSPDLRDVARDLGVRYVLEGSVRKGGSRIRVTGQLIDGGTGNHIWAERFDRQLDDIFDLQDEITENIVSAIGPEIDQAERDRARRLPPENLNAWEQYQRGLWHLYKFNSADNAEAQRLFRGATAVASNFAPGQSGLTHSLYYAYMHGYAADRINTLEIAYESGRAATSADPRDADAHFALGRILYLRRDHENSTAAFEVAIAQNPNFAHAHLGLATAHLWSGIFQESVKRIDLAARLSPNDPILWLFMTVKGLALQCLNQNEEASITMLEAIRHSNAAWTAHCVRASVLGQLGNHAQAANALRETLHIKPDLNIDHLHEILPFQNEADFDRVLKGLKNAGMDI